MNWKWEMIKLWFKFSLVWFIVVFICVLITGLTYGVKEGAKIIIQSIEWYFIIIGLYLAYRFIKFVLKGNEYSKKANETLLINRDNYAKKVNKEIYYFNEYRAIAFNNETKKFEYLKIELPNGEKYKKILFDFDMSLHGYDRHYKDDFFSKCIFEYYPIKNLATNTQYMTQTVATHNVDIISKQRHVNKTTAINEVVLTLDNDAQFEFDTDGCKDVEFMHHPAPKFLMNKDTQGEYFPSFSSYYEKYALKVKKVA